MDVLTEAERERVADVFSSHRAFVESVARQHSPSPDDVPDIVQTVAVQVCRSLNGFRDESQLATWLYRVTVNTARSHYRREVRLGRVVQALTDDQAAAAAALAGGETRNDPPDLSAIRGERIQAVRDAMDRLRPAYQVAIRDQMAGSGVKRDRMTRWRARQELRTLLADDPRVAE